MGQILHGSATTTEAVRRAIQNSQASLRVLARRYGINQKTVAKWKKRSSVSDHSNRPHECKILGVVGRGRGHHRCLSPAHAPAVGRLPLCAPADDPAPDAILATPLPAASWHFEAAGSRRRQTGQEEVQGLSDRLFPHRHCRSTDRRRQAVPVCCDRPDQQICLRTACEEDR